MEHFGHSVDIISAHRIEQFVIWYSMRIQASHVVKERRASRDFRQRDAKADGNATASAGTTAGVAETAGRQSREPQLCALASLRVQYRFPCWTNFLFRLSSSLFDRTIAFGSRW